jgi:putative transposase
VWGGFVPNLEHREEIGCHCLPAFYSSFVPRNLKRYYGAGDFHFVTFSCHRRLPFLRHAWRRYLFLRTLEQVRQQYELVVLGYVVMPEHVHLLVSEPRKRNLSVALKALKQAVARRLLGSARRQKQDASQLALFQPDELPQRFWQRRFYDFKVPLVSKVASVPLFLHWKYGPITPKAKLRPYFRFMRRRLRI